MSNNYDISIKRGIAYRLYFNFVNENNTPIDLSNTTGIFTIKRYPSSDISTLICTETGITANFIANDTNQYSIFSSTQAIKFNTNEYGVVGNTGGILIHIPSEMTHYVAEGRYLFNLVVGLTSGNMELLSGRLYCEDNLSAGPILPYTGPTGATNDNLPLRPFVASTNYTAYALKQDDSIIYWGNIEFGNNNTYQYGTLVGFTASEIRALPNGMIAVLNTNPLDNENTNIKFLTPNISVYYGAGISQEGFLIPRSENLKPIKDIAFSESNVVALQEDGTVFVWGTNWAPSENGDEVTDFPIGVTFEKIVAGSYHVLGLKSDGTVVAWGNNTEGQCNVPDDLTNVVEIAANSSYSLARKSDNTFVCWGALSSGLCDEIPPSLTYSKLIAGPDYYLGIRSTGRLDIIPDGYLPTPVTTRKFKDAYASTYFYVTREAANSTGTNSRPENTINSFPNTTVEGEEQDFGVPNTGLTGDFIAVSEEITIVGKTGGAISIHYNPDYYDYGVMEMNDIPNVSSIKKIVGGSNAAIVLDNNGSVYGWGNNMDNHISIPYQGFTFVKQIEMGANHAILLDKIGQIRCIGNNIYGQCDVPKNLTGITSIWAGRNFSGVIKEDGTILGWGETRQYTNPSFVPLDTVLMPKLNSSGITGAKKVSVGYSELFVLTDRGTIIGITGASWSSVSNIPGTSYINFFAGNFYTSYGYTSGISLSNIKYMSDQNQDTKYHFAISESGIIYGWGHNTEIPARNELISIPDGDDEILLDAPLGLTFKHVEKGQGLIIAIDGNNDVIVWGEAEGRSLGTLPPNLQT